MPKEIKKLVYTFREMLDLNKDGKKISDKAVEKARQWLQEGATDYNWWEFVYDEWTKMLESVGFVNPEINFSGFASQGDGASFKAEVDMPVLIGFLANTPPVSESLNVKPGSDPSGDEYDWPPFLIHKVKGVRSNPKFAKLMRILDRLEMRVVRHTHQYSHERTCGVESCFNDGGEFVDGPKAGERVWKSRQPILSGIWKDFVDAVEQLRLDCCRAIYRDLEEEYDSRMEDSYLLDMAEGNDWTFDAYGDRDG